LIDLIWNYSRSLAEPPLLYTCMLMRSVMYRTDCSQQVTSSFIRAAAAGAVADLGVVQAGLIQMDSMCARASTIIRSAPHWALKASSYLWCIHPRNC